MTKQELQKAKNAILKRIKSTDNFAILVSDPDSDAIGSGLAMEEILEQMGKKVKLYSSFEINAYASHPRFEKFIIKDIARLDFGQFKTIISLDAGEPQRLLDSRKHSRNFEFPKEVFVINIDHHDSSSLYGNINYVNTKFSSTAEAIYEIFNDKIDFTPSIKTNLHAGIMGDTGCFRNIGSTTSRTLRIVADLIEKDVNHDLNIIDMFYSFDPHIIRKNLKLLESFKTQKVGKYRFVYTVMDMKKIKLNTMSRRPLSLAEEILKGVNKTDFSLRIKVYGNTLTKLSFRSRTREVVKIAEHFGGGGHNVAAGASVKMSVEETLRELENFLKSAKLPKVC